MTCLTVDPTSTSPFEAAPAARNEIPSDPAFAAARDALRRAEESVNTALAEIHTSRARFRGTAGVSEALHAARTAQPVQESEE